MPNMQFSQRLCVPARQYTRAMINSGPGVSMPHDMQSPEASTLPAATAQKCDLLGKSRDALRAWMAQAGEPAYRGAQLYHALYAERRFDFAAMTNLPAALRARLAEEARITLPQILRRFP